VHIARTLPAVVIPMNPVPPFTVSEALATPVSLLLLQLNRRPKSTKLICLHLALLHLQMPEDPRDPTFWPYQPGRIIPIHQLSIFSVPIWF